MIDQGVLKLLKSFKGSFVNESGEFIANHKANSYFNLGTCKDELEVKCKVLEWLSRDAFKTEPFRTKKQNEAFHTAMMDGINRYLETNFTQDDMSLIYQELGNQVNRENTMRFIESGYDHKVLEELE